MDLFSGMILVALPIALFSVLLPVALMLALQVWLCKKSLKLGLILPVLSLVMSLLITLPMLLNVAVTDDGSGPRILLTLGILFLITNIPTVVFGGIWLHYKGRRDTLDDLKKMRIEDLE